MLRRRTAFTASAIGLGSKLTTYAVGLSGNDGRADGEAECDHARRIGFRSAGHHRGRFP